MATLGQKPATTHVSFQKQTITGNGGTSYTLQQSVGSELDIAVFINNTRQEPTTAYTASGTSLVMTGAVNSSDNFYVIFLAKAINTTGLPVSAVNTASINASAVTNDKIANSTIDLTSKVTGVLPAANSQTNAPAFLAKMSADQDLTSATDTKMQFDTEVYDTDGKYDHSTNYRFTPGVAGTYFLYGQVHGKSNNNSEVADMILSIRKNGTSIYAARKNFQSNRPNQISINLQFTDVANTTDYYELFMYMSDQSGNPTMDAVIGGGWVASTLTFFGGYKLIGL